MPFIIYYIVQSVKYLMGWYEKWETYIISTGETVDRFVRYPPDFMGMDINNNLRYFRYIMGDTDVPFRENQSIRRIEFAW